MKNILSKYALFILPLIFLYFGYNFHRCTYGFDPEYAYLMNGLMINNCDYVGHTDNPGTTVQSYSALVLRIAHQFGFKNDLQTDVLKNPDHFIETGRKGLTIINAFFFILLGFLIFHFTKNVWLSLIIQITPYLSSNLLEHAWARFSPEPMLVITTNMMIIAIISHYFSKNRNWKYFSWIFGAIAGFGMATKVTFLPILIIPIFILANRQMKINYFKAILSSFVFFTIPAIPVYPQMLKWFFRLFTHTGVYGSGGSGLIDPAKYFNDLLLIFKNNIALTSCITVSLVSIVVLILKKSLKVWFEENNKVKYMFALFTAQLTGVLMVAKHYHANHYLIPVNALCGLSLIFLILMATDLNFSKKLVVILPLIITIIMITGSSFNIPYMKYADKGYANSNEETIILDKMLKADFEGYVKVNYIDRINKYSALKYGNAYSRQKFNTALTDLYPDGLFYNPNNNSLQNWENDIGFWNFIKSYGKRIIIIDGPFTEKEELTLRNKGLILNKIYIGNIHNIYEIDTTDSKIFLNLKHNLLWQISFDPDSVSSDGNFFVSGNHRTPNTWHRSDEAAYSGKNSAKLSGSNNYAFDFLLDYIQEGQEYQVTVWRKATDSKTFIVASSVEPGEFWTGSDKVVATANDGWEKIVMKFTISGNISQGIKVFVWNNSEKAVYLDDFIVTRLK